MLASPDFEKQFVLQTDASEYGVGAVLSQWDAAGSDRPITYFSRKLLPREVWYSTVEKECLAIKLDMETFRVYLLSWKFTVEMDHRSLVWLNKLKGSNTCLTRLHLSLQTTQWCVHRAGLSNGNSDVLSQATRVDEHNVATISFVAREGWSVKEWKEADTKTHMSMQ